MRAGVCEVEVGEDSQPAGRHGDELDWRRVEVAASGSAAELSM